MSLESALVSKGIVLVSRFFEKHRRCNPCSRNKRVAKARTRCQEFQEHRCGNYLIRRRLSRRSCRIRRVNLH